MKSFNGQCSTEKQPGTISGDPKYPDGYWQNCSVEADEIPTTQTPLIFSASVVFSDKWNCQGRVGFLPAGSVTSA